MFIHKKRTKAGHRFGFVRFLHVREPRSLARELDQAFLGGMKLFVNLPQFNKAGDEKLAHSKRLGKNRDKVAAEEASRKPLPSRVPLPPV